MRCGVEVLLCGDTDWLSSDEAFSIYSACMFEPEYGEYKARMECFLSDQSVKIFVCEEDGTKAGILVLSRSNRVPEIIGIAVAENRRGRGIGRYMVLRIMEIESLECIKAQTDDDAIGFYRRCGFAEERTVTEYPDGISVRYDCRLCRENAADGRGRKAGDIMLTAYKPERQDLWFRRMMLADAETMSYNHAWGGTIEFPEDKWDDWYDYWVADNGGRRYYRYLKDENGSFVGEIAYHYDEELCGYAADVIIFSKYRRRGFGARALDMLSFAARENGIDALYDDIAIDNPAISLFLKSGFAEEYRTDDKIILKKEL